MFFLIFILIFIIGFMYYKYESRLTSNKKQILLLCKKNKQLKDKLEYELNKFNNLNFIFKECSFKSGVINDNCNLFLAPIENAPKLLLIEKDTIVTIWHSAEISDNIWYEISFFQQENLNNRGWILEENITKVNDSSN